MLVGVIAVFTSCGSDKATTAATSVTVTAPGPAATAPTTAPPTTAVLATVPATEPRTTEPRTTEPRTSDPTTSEPTTSEPTTSDPTTSDPTTPGAVTTTVVRTTAVSTTGATSVPTTGRTGGGWAIHDAIASQQSGAITKYDAVSCTSLSGPWHVVASFTVDGNLTQNVFYDVVIASNGTGTLTGEEHSTWSNGETVDGTNTGSAQLTGSDPDAMLVLDYDSVVVIVDPKTGTDTQTDHHNKPLKVIPATGTECA